MKTRVGLKYFVSYCRFNCVLSSDNLPRVKEGAYVVNFDDNQSKEH